MITSYPSATHSLTKQASFATAGGPIGTLPRRPLPRAKSKRQSTATQLLAAKPERQIADYARFLPLRCSDAHGKACVVGVGRAQVRPGDDYPIGNPPKLYQVDWRSGRVLPDLQLLVLSDAKGEFESRETGHVRIDGQAIVFLLPGVWHRFRPDRRHGWTERWISVGSDAAHQLVDQGLVDPEHPVLVPDDMASILRNFDALAEYVRRHPNRQSAELSQLALELMSHAAGSRVSGIQGENAETNAADFESDDSIVEQAREIIWNHGQLRAVCVSDVAKQLPVTRRTLDRRFAQSVGHSVLDEINSCRLWRAKRLLEETDLLIKTIAYLAGFPSRERMRLLFLCNEGATPSEYRERSKKQYSPQ